MPMGGNHLFLRLFERVDMLSSHPHVAGVWWLSIVVILLPIARDLSSITALAHTHSTELFAMYIHGKQALLRRTYDAGFNMSNSPSCCVKMGIRLAFHAFAHANAR